MKRNFSNVTKDHVKSLKKWLEVEDKAVCPFNDNGILCEDDICPQVFPSLDPSWCPCNHLETKYVEKIARKIIKELSCQQSI